jgi:hypothetical protein
LIDEKRSRQNLHRVNAIISKIISQKNGDENGDFSQTMAMKTAIFRKKWR